MTAVTDPRRHPNAPIQALIDELGSLNDGYGGLRAFSLKTPDPLDAVLRPDYFATSGAAGMEPGDLILCVTELDTDPVVSMLLVLDVSPVQLPGRGAPKVVVTRLLQTWGSDQ